MPKVNARMYVGIRIPTSERGSGTVIARSVVRPGGRSMLEVLRNGGGKSTLTAIELAALSPRLGGDRTRIRGLFRADAGPSYVAFDLERDGKSWAAGYNHVYLICGIERRRSDEDAGDIRRSWAILPAAVAGRFEGLPLSRRDDGRFFPIALEDFAKWARSFDEGRYITDRSLTDVEEAFRGIGLSPKEMRTQLTVNYDEGGIENYFRRGTTPEAFFEGCLMPVVKDGVQGGREAGWLAEDVIDLAKTARNRMSEISELEAAREYGRCLSTASHAMQEDFDARHLLSELEVRACRLESVASNRKEVLRRMAEETDEELGELDAREREVAHIDLSREFHQSLEQRDEDEKRARSLEEERDGLRVQLADVNAALARFDASKAYERWDAKRSECDGLSSALDALRSRAGKLDDRAREYQAMALHAWNTIVSQLEQKRREAIENLDLARSAEAAARDGLDRASEERDQSLEEKTKAETELGIAYEALAALVDKGPAVQECARIISAKNLDGFYDLHAAEMLAESMRKKAEDLAMRLKKAVGAEGDAKANVELLEEDRRTAEQRESEARSRLNLLSEKLEHALQKYLELDEALRAIDRGIVGNRDDDAVEMRLTKLKEDISAKLSIVHAAEKEAQLKIDAFDRGTARVDERLLRLVDEHGIKFRTAAEFAGDQGVDLAFFLEEAPWLADVLFMEEDEADAFKEALVATGESGDALLALVSTAATLEETLGGASPSIAILSNAKVEWVSNPAEWRAKLVKDHAMAKDAVDTVKAMDDACETARIALAVCRSATEEWGSLPALQEEHAAAEEAHTAASSAVKDARARLVSAERGFTKATSERERAEADSNHASLVSEKCAQLSDLIGKYNTKAKRYTVARLSFAEKDAALTSSKKELEAAERSRVLAAQAKAAADENLDTARRKMSEVSGRGIVPVPDPEGRSAEALTTSWRVTCDELKTEQADHGAQIASLETELNGLHREEALLGETLAKACSAAGIVESIAAEIVGTFTSDTVFEFEERRLTLEPTVKEKEDGAGQARLAAARSDERHNQAVRNLEKGQFEAPLPRDVCWGFDVEAERHAIRSRRTELADAKRQMQRESDSVSLISGNARSMMRDLAGAGSFEDYRPLSDETVGIDDAEEECSALEAAYRSAIDRRAATVENARAVVSEIAKIPSLKDAIAAQAATTTETLLRALGPTTEIAFEGSLKRLGEAIDSCAQLQTLLSSRLEGYETRLGQTARVCARDVVDAIGMLAGIVRDATIDVSRRGEPRRRIPFLEISLGGRNVSTIRDAKNAASLIDDAEATLLPFLRSYVEGTLASVENDDQARAAVDSDLDLGRLVRIFIGGGATPCGVDLKHATATKTEYRRHQNWSSLFKHGSMGQSGAETTLVFFVVYLAVTKSMRSTEIPEGGGDERFLILDNPFTKMSDEWAVEFLGRVANHFGCQLIVKTALREIVSRNVFPVVCSYREGRRAADGTIVLDHEVDYGDGPIDQERDFDVFVTTAVQTALDL